MHNLARNRKSTLHNLETKKRTLHNLVENLKALGFHQEQMETMEGSAEIPGLVLYQTLFYLLEKNSYYKFRLEYKNLKIQVIILMCLAILLSKHHT